jgi:hypothetical protein
LDAEREEIAQETRAVFDELFEVWRKMAVERGSTRMPALIEQNLEAYTDVAALTDVDRAILRSTTALVQFQVENVFLAVAAFLAKRGIR